MIQRRPFCVTFLVAGLGAVPWPAVAQETRKLARIGFLEAGSASANQHFLDAFQNGLREFGYLPGKTVVIDARWAEGRAENFPKLLAELMPLRPDVIVVASTLGAKAAKVVVTSTPVVFVGVADPLEAGLVANLARPGGNFTGLSRVFGEGLIGKAAQLLETIVPRASRYAILWNADGAVEPRLREARAAIRTLGKTPLPFEVHGSADFDNAFTAMRAARADALLVIADPLTLGHRRAIVELAARERIPAVYKFAEFARAGGLVAYSADVPALFQRAALYVDKILKGTPPGDLPVEQPNKFALVVNLKTAKALGLTIPQSLLLRADEVID
jgi:putative ABC transport system substrate-binding protein